MQITPELCSSADTAYAEPNRPTTHRTPEEILAHPRFGAARTAYIEAILGLYEHDRFMSQLLIEAARSIVFFNTLAIYAGYDVADRATWPTISLLKQTLAPFGLSTARRVDGLITQLVRSGYLTLSTAPGDRRVRVLTPTEKMIAHDLDWLAAHYRPLRVMFPETGYDQPTRRDPVFQKTLRRISRGFMEYAAQFMASNPEVMFFMEHDAGTMILIKMIHLGKTVSMAQLSFSELGDKFGVSRTHVRKIVQEAEKRGLLHRTESAISVAPALTKAYDRFVADTMSGHDIMFKMATCADYEKPKASARVNSPERKETA